MPEVLSGLLCDDGTMTHELRPVQGLSSQQCLEQDIQGDLQLLDVDKESKGIKLHSAGAEYLPDDFRQFAVRFIPIRRHLREVRQR